MHLLARHLKISLGSYISLTLSLQTFFYLVITLGGSVPPLSDAQWYLSILPVRLLQIPW